MADSKAMTSEGVGIFRESDASPGEYEEVSEVVSWSGPGGSAPEYDVTHLKSSGREIRIGLPDNGNVTLECNYIPTDKIQKAMRADREARTKKSYRLVYTDASPASTDTFDAYVMGFSTAGGVNNKVSCTITLRVTGAVTPA